MKKILSLNKEIKTQTENLDQLIAELEERHEFVCTGNACVTNICGVHDI